MTRLKTLGPINIAIGQGLTFDYFDDVRKIIEPARSDLFFIDRYLEAEFVSQICAPCRPWCFNTSPQPIYKIPALCSAVEVFVEQTGAKSEHPFHE